MFSQKRSGHRDDFRIPRKFGKKLKIFLGVGLAGLMLSLFLVGWAGVATVRYMADLVKDPNVQGQVENLQGQVENLQGRAANLQAELEKLPALAKLGCWEKAQSLVNIEVWLETPVGANIASLKAACLEKKVEICQGVDCEAVKQIKT